MENTALAILSKLLKQPGMAATIEDEIASLPKPLRDGLIKRLLQLPELSIIEIATGINGHNPFISGRLIMTTDWPEIIWAIPDIFPAGLTIFAGKSKLGKSWFMMQAAHSVATGGIFLDRQVEQGKVCYLALEDSERRIKSRMKIQDWSKEAQENVEFMFSKRFQEEVGKIDESGSNKLAQYIERYEFRMVVIDTFSRAMGGDQNDVREMTAWLSPLQIVAQDLNIAIIMIDHHKKSVGEYDATTDILGSTGKAAVADTSVGLYRERGKPGAQLHIVGRDVEETKYDIFYDRVTGCWQLDSEGFHKMDPFHADLLSALEEIGPAQLSKVIVTIGLDKENDRDIQKVRRALILLEREGKTRQVKNPEHRYPLWDIIRLP